MTLRNELAEFIESVNLLVEDGHTLRAITITYTDQDDKEHTKKFVSKRLLVEVK